MRMVDNLSEASAERVLQARAQAALTTTEDMALRAQLDVKGPNALASGDPLLSGHRRPVGWGGGGAAAGPGPARRRAHE